MLKSLVTNLFDLYARIHVFKITKTKLPSVAAQGERVESGKQWDDINKTGTKSQNSNLNIKHEHHLTL